MAERRLIARNSASDSENKIHDDETAQRLGFRGGLVPGVALAAYLVPVVVADLGEQWLDDGTIDVRFVAPVYEGDEVIASCGGGTLTATTGTRPCVRGEATVGGAAAEPRLAATVGRDIPGTAAPPRPRPPATESTLAAGTVLTTIEHRADAERIRSYLTSIGDDAAWWEEREVAHPGWLLRDANETLARSVRLGPWIHARTQAAVLSRARLGAEIRTRAVVVDEFERNGHRMVVLDVHTAADDRPTLRVTHTAIWRPRQVADAAC